MYAEILSSSYQETFNIGCSEILPKLILFTLEKCSGRSVRVCWVFFFLYCLGLPNYQIRMVSHWCGDFILVLLSFSLCTSWFLVLGCLCAIGVKLLALKKNFFYFLFFFNKLLSFQKSQTRAFSPKLTILSTLQASSTPNLPAVRVTHL